MQHEEVLRLIEGASDIAGSDYKLAKMMGIPRQHLSDYKHGKRNAQPEDIAILASLQGLDGSAWALRAMVEKHEGTAKGDRLMKAVGKALLATGAMIGGAGANAMVIYSATSETVAKPIEYFIRCIHSLSQKARWRLV